MSFHSRAGAGVLRHAMVQFVHTIASASISRFQLPTCPRRKQYYLTHESVTKPHRRFMRATIERARRRPILKGCHVMVQSTSSSYTRSISILSLTGWHALFSVPRKGKRPEADSNLFRLRTTNFLYRTSFVRVVLCRGQSKQAL